MNNTLHRKITDNSVRNSRKFMRKFHLLSFFVSLAILLFSLSFQLSAQLETPLEKNTYSKPSSYAEITEFIQQLCESSPLVTVEVAGKSVQGRNLYALRFSSNEFGKDSSKLRVLIFAQQHGNEQSGKEGALLLARDLLKIENRYLFDRLDFLLIPQMNPDGSEVNKRRNGNNADLNRNHLILTEPETRALHQIFDRYLFEVSMDVHEFYPYGDSWKAYGYRSNTQELIGTATNVNVSEKLRNLSGKGTYPFLMDYFRSRQVTSFVYAPGDPPGKGYTRHSTFDINDGRQSLAIQNTLSFIQEGMNGSDAFAENLKNRSYNQMTGMRALLEYAWINKDSIKTLVSQERAALISGKPGDKISIQSGHVSVGTKLSLPAFSYSTLADTLIEIEDYRPVVQSTLDVQKPLGYLVPVNQKTLVDWIARQNIETRPVPPLRQLRLEQYRILKLDSIDFEGDRVVNPLVKTGKAKTPVHSNAYIYIPTAQLKGNMIVIALEPKSMLGLVTYPLGASLLQAGELYPVLRVLTKKK